MRLGKCIHPIRGKLILGRVYKLKQSLPYRDRYAVLNDDTQRNMAYYKSRFKLLPPLPLIDILYN